MDATPLVVFVARSSTHTPDGQIIAPHGYLACRRCPATSQKVRYTTRGVASIYRSKSHVTVCMYVCMYIHTFLLDSIVDLLGGLGTSSAGVLRMLYGVRSTQPHIVFL